MQVLEQPTVDSLSAKGGHFIDTIKIGIDGAEPVEIVCAGPHPQVTTLDQIVKSINLVFPGIALHDGKQIHLASHSVGPRSQLEFAVPGSRNATAAIFGIPAPRTYHGDAPGSARRVPAPPRSSRRACAPAGR